MYILFGCVRGGGVLGVSWIEWIVVIGSFEVDGAFDVLSNDSSADG